MLLFFLDESFHIYSAYVIIETKCEKAQFLEANTTILFFAVFNVCRISEFWSKMPYLK